MTDQLALRPRWATSFPFVLFFVIGLATMTVPPYDHHWLKLALAALVFAALLAVHAFALVFVTPTWLDPVPAYASFLVIALLRDGSGGTTSGLAPLVAAPIFWLAVYGTRRQLHVAAGLTGLTFVLPLVVVGAPDYPLSDWKRAVLWMAVAVLIGPIVQHLVAQLRDETRRARQSEAQVRALMDGAHLSSLISTDVEGTITTFGVGAEALLGRRAAAMVGRPAHEAFHDPDEVAAVAAELGVEPGFAVFAELAARRAPSRIWTFVRADGTRLSVRLAVTELRDAAGELFGYLGVAIDATEAVRAQRALADAELRWRVVMDHLPDTTLIVADDAQRVTLVSGAGAMREKVAHVTGRPLGEVASPGNAELLVRLAADAVRGTEGRAELSSARTGNEHEVQVVPLPHADGNAEALILARDVSRDRARERALQEAKERAERLFVDAPNAVLLHDDDGRITAANPAACTLFARAHDHLTGADLGRLSVVAHDRTVELHLASLRQGAGLAESVWTVQLQDGTQKFLTLSSRVLAGAGGEERQVLTHVGDLTERRRYEQQLAHLADHDPLTGLANRRRFDTELSAHLELCRRYGASGAVLMLDLDHFKEVNDTLGHAAGDELIVSLASLLKEGLRTTDVVARLGGDEFAILLPRAGREAAEFVAAGVVERVRGAMRVLDGTRRKVTASVGVVMVDGRHTSSGEMMASADMMMYDAKEAGRDQYAILDFKLHSQPRIGARLAWHDRVERAIENDGFVLHLQPILDVRSGRVTGAEALLRMVDGDVLVPPSRFLYVAERSDQVVRLDTWVVQRAVALLADLQRVRPDFRLEVNLSGRSIGHPDVEQALMAALARHPVDPSGLVLEITETAAVSNVEAARSFAERVSAVGCRFALDDFGAGFGSFYYLKHLLFDYVKIDGEFVSHIHRSPTDRAIVQSIVGITHGLGKRAVAEFVSDRDVLDAVRAEGVDFAQGYFIGRPVPVEQFVADLDRPLDLGAPHVTGASEAAG